MGEHVKVLTHTADTVSALAIIGTFAGFLPPLAALCAAVWYCVQVWESKTVQKWLRKRHIKRVRKNRIDSRSRR